ncbi:uncharacterized protein LOC122869274 [Siniperca chuatsi]|uniref:uncharacterized protein LOC122869274 n=1 Tax=Siniperca chuatsi TaxID=119488 RepID=UPI001CE22AFC|nr:uncharacterized protein LOC122869274 [Siniperca chuatsi]
MPAQGRGRRVPGQGRGVRMRGGAQRRTRARVTDQIRATIIDRVINHGLPYREAGERVQPNLSRDTVASIVRIFRETNRIQHLPPSGGRGKLLNEEQELAIVNMVIADNEIKLKDIQSRVVEDNLVFGNIAAISTTSISRTLAKHRVRMKQLYKVPFERNSERIKELCHQYVQRVMELEANQVPHGIIYVNEAGEKASLWEKHNWQKGHSYRAGPERSQHHHVRRNLQQQCTPA